MRESHEFRVQFSHGRVLFDPRNVQKRETKSDTSGHCLPRSALLSPALGSQPAVWAHTHEARGGCRAFYCSTPTYPTSYTHATPAAGEQT